MSIPTNELVFAGIWNVATYYPQYQFVISPIDGKAYVQVGVNTLIGGADPSTGVPVWVNIPNVTGPAGPAGPAGPPGPPPFPPAYGSFSSDQGQALIQNFTNDLVYTQADVPPVGCAPNPALPTSAIRVINTGLYKVLSSVQLDRTMGGNSEIDMFPLINGTPVPLSATKLLLNQNEESVMTVEWFLQMNANDNLSIRLFTADTGNLGLYVAPTTGPAPFNVPIPAIPPVITTILRIA